MGADVHIRCRVQGHKMAEWEEKDGDRTGTTLVIWAAAVDGREVNTVLPAVDGAWTPLRPGRAGEPPQTGTMVGRGGRGGRGDAHRARCFETARDLIFRRGREYVWECSHRGVSIGMPLRH